MIRLPTSDFRLQTFKIELCISPRFFDDIIDSVLHEIILARRRSIADSRRQATTVYIPSRYELVVRPQPAARTGRHGAAADRSLKPGDE